MLDKLKQVTLSSEKLDILMGLGCYHNFEKLEWLVKMKKKIVQFL